MNRKGRKTGKPSKPPAGGPARRLLKRRRCRECKRLQHPTGINDSGVCTDCHDAPWPPSDAKIGAVWGAYGTAEAITTHPHKTSPVDLNMSKLESPTGVPVQRMVSLRDLKPQPDGTHVTCLPDGYVLINATSTESKIVELYAAECLRLKPSESIGYCQQANVES